MRWIVDNQARKENNLRLLEILVNKEVADNPIRKLIRFNEEDIPIEKKKVRRTLKQSIINQGRRYAKKLGCSKSE